MPCVRILQLLAVAGVAASAAAAELDPLEKLPGADRPPVGRSLLDHLLVDDGGTTFDIPYPIEKLIDRLAAKTGSRPRVLMIPRGRSLQRDHTSFDEPRLVFAFDQPHQQSGNDLGVLSKDRLYLGFASQGDHNQIEAISFNAAAGRFEFQLIKDYKAGATPRLFYASRNFCMRCHHNGAPIFSPNPWPETNGVTMTETRIAELIERGSGAAGGKYHGYDVRTPLDVAYEVDNAVQRANYLIPYNHLWMEGCGGGGATDAAQCRGLVLRFALELSFSSTPAWASGGGDFQQLQSIWERTWPQNLGGGLKVPTASLLHFNPLEDSGTGGAFADLRPGLSPADAERVQELLGNAQVPAAKDPLFQFLGPLEVWKLDSVCYGKCAIYGVNKLLTSADKRLIKDAAQGDAARLKQAVDRLVQAGDEALANRPFRRSIVVKALLRELGAAAPQGGGEDDAPAMPALQVDSGDATAPSAGALALMKDAPNAYCMPCHQSLSGKRGFLNGASDAVFVEKIRAIKAEMLVRLRWEEPEKPGHALMPVQSDEAGSPYQRLLANPEHRQEMIEWLEGL